MNNLPDALRNARPAGWLEIDLPFLHAQPLAICGRLDNFHHAVYVVIEHRASSEKFLFLLGRRNYSVTREQMHAHLFHQSLDPLMIDATTLVN